DREVTVNELTDEWQSRINYTPLNQDRKSYLERIDGIVYGPNPRQGYVAGLHFYHPDLEFQFPVPDNWQVINTANTVMIVSPEKDAIIQFGFVNATSPGAAADKFVADAGTGVQRRESSRVNGFSAEIVESESHGQTRMVSYFIQKERSVYAFHGYSLIEKFAGFASSFARVMTGFDKVTDPVVLSKQPERLRIERAPKAGTLESVLGEMGVPSSRTAEFARLNGRAATERIEKGELLKVIR
ncbi:MAG: hypothetical protein O7D32_05840, partial [bacterium]|nr:hypothetical protein [bacterium]